MSKVKVTLWNREFDIPVSYSCYPGEEITSGQKETLEEFCSKERPVEGTLNELKKYVINTSNGAIEDDIIDNIFKYVMPKAIHIPRDKGTVAVICNYKFDMENGIAVVLYDGKLKEIGTQDIIL